MTKSIIIAVFTLAVALTGLSLINSVEDIASSRNAAIEAALEVK